MRTCPSRPPVAIRWYDRPHEGAQATEVIEKGGGVVVEVDSPVPVVAVVGSPPPAAPSKAGGCVAGGVGLRVRTQVDRWEES